MKKLIILALALLAACAAQAIPTLTGPTGGFELPTADVAHGVTVSIDNNTWSTLIHPVGAVTWGVTDRIEVGGNFSQAWGARKAGTQNPYDPMYVVDARFNTWSVNAKYQLVRARTVQVAVGALYGELYDASIDAQGYSQIASSLVDHQHDVYLAGTCVVAGGLTASANLGYGENYYTDRKGLNGGVALDKSLGTQTHVGAEWLCHDNTGLFGTIVSNSMTGADVTHANVYLEQQIDTNLSARIAFAGIGQADQFVVGASYSF